MGTGGLDKIVELDDEGGGEQAEEDEKAPCDLNSSLTEEVDKIY